MELPRMTELFFERLKTQQGAWPQVFSREILPDQAKTQVWHLFTEAEGISSKHVKAAVEKIRFCIGVKKLNKSGDGNDWYEHNYWNELEAFLYNGIRGKTEEENTNLCLSALEVICQLIKRPNLSTEKTVNEINKRLRLSGVGYCFVGNELIPIDDELLLENSTIPTVSLLNREEFHEAYAYLYQAYQDYRSDDGKALENAVDNTAKAAETLLKHCFQELDIEYNPTHTYMRLIQTAKEKGLFPNVDDDKLNPLMNNLKALGNIRNEAGGHGGKKKTANRMVRLALNHATSNMLFIAESYLELKNT